MSCLTLKTQVIIYSPARGRLDLTGAPTSITVDNPRSGAVTAVLALPHVPEIELVGIAEGDGVEVSAGYLESPDGVAPIFSGYLSRIEFSRAGTSFHLEDECWKLKRKMIEMSFEETPLVVIAQAILTWANVANLSLVPAGPLDYMPLLNYNPAGMNALEALLELGRLVGCDFGFIPGRSQPWFGYPSHLSRLQPLYPYAMLGDNVVSNDLKKTILQPVSQVAVVFTDPGNLQDPVVGMFPEIPVVAGEPLLVLRTGAADEGTALQEAARLYKLHLKSKYTGSLAVFGWPLFHAGQQFRLIEMTAGVGTDLGLYYAESVTQTVNGSGFFTRITLPDPGGEG